MTDLQIDRMLGQTPCLCGDVTTWHQQCYANKTAGGVEAAYRRVYKRIRAQLRKQRRIDISGLAERMRA